MTGIWWSSSTFEHCLFVLPIIAWLVWQRADQLRRLRARGWAPGLLIVAAGAGGWLLGQAAGVAFARHLGLVLMIQGSIVAVLGPAVARGLLFPLGYALFLVPAGEALVPPLQNVTAWLCMGMLDMAGVPARRDGVFITTPGGWFEVAEACSGAKFLLAMIAFGTLAAHLCFRSRARRALFMAAAMIVPVLANGVRAFATILVAQWTGVETAGGFDHVVYGWIFFAVVIAVLLAASWRFFDRSVHEPAIDARAIGPVATQAYPHGAMAAAAAAALIAAAVAGWAQRVEAGAGSLAGPIVLAPPPRWQVAAQGAGPEWTPNFPGTDRFVQRRFRDAAGRTVDVAVAAYGSQSEGRELVGFGIGAVPENGVWAKASDGAPIVDGQTIRIVAPGERVRDVAVFYSIGGRITGSETRVKFETLRARLLGGDARAVAVLVSAEAPAGGSGRAAIDAFLTAAGPVGRIAERALR